MYMVEVNSSPAQPAVSRWRPQGFGPVSSAQACPLVSAADAVPILPGIDLWDSWPLAHEDGRTVVHNGQRYWFMLSAPCLPDPAQRHDAARIRLLGQGPAGWRDLGRVLPDEASPGSREWAGSAVLHDDGVGITLFFTAAGRQGQPHTAEQRLFAVAGRLGTAGPEGWGEPREIVAVDGRRYAVPAPKRASPSLIGGFRDPAWLRDPATGLAHVLFTGSAAWSADVHNGLIGVATRQHDGGWALGDPLIDAVGVNSELERPHVVLRGGLYYLFWSTQTHTFARTGSAGPDGLYGAVAPAMSGPWVPLNGTGLVAANPAQEPAQSYSWWVTGEGEVWSFINYWGLAGRSLADHPELVRNRFGGTPAPVFRLAFSGERVGIA